MDGDSRVKPDAPATPQERSPKQRIPDYVSPDDADRPPSAQPRPAASTEHSEDLSDDEPEDEMDDQQQDSEADPSEQIVDFDWDDLMKRYHQAMQDFHDEENELTAEFENLMTYFRIWANAGNDHETDRTYKRLRTRAAYVQNSEATLDKTRNHYISVVKAFESALNLLKVHGFGG